MEAFVKIAELLINTGYQEVLSELNLYPGNEKNIAGLDEVDYKTYKIALESIKTGIELLKVAKK